MHKNLLTLAMIVACVVTAQAADNLPLSRHFNRPPQLYCDLLSNLKYTALPEPTHVEESNWRIHFASRRNEILLGRDTVQLADNESVFYAFCAPTKAVADHLNSTLANEVKQIEYGNQSDIRSNIASTLNQILIDFCKKNDPFDVHPQRVAAIFLHFLNEEVCPYGFYCTQSGHFTHLNDDPYYSLNSPEEDLLIFSVPKSPDSDGFCSAFNNLIKTNMIAREASAQNPEKFANELVKKDSNQKIIGAVILDKHRWLELCKRPEKTEAYEALEQQWHASIPVATNKIEKEILGHRDDSAEDLAAFAKEFRKGHKESQEHAAYFTFLHDITEQKRAEEANSIKAQVANLFATLCKGCGSR